MHSYTVGKENGGQRLDKFLTEQMPDTTRSQLQKLIKSGVVLVNSKPAPVHRFLKIGDTVEVTSQPTAAVPTASKPVPKNVTPPPDPTVVFENTDYAVLHKPAGLLVHEGAGEKEPTLVDWLLKKYPTIAKVGEDPARPGIVHRLDREVSGLLVVAKTQAMFDCLKEQFHNRTVRKEYTALVNGTPAKTEDEITFNIDRSETADHKMAAVPTSGSDDRGRHSITAFEVVERIGRYTLLRVLPRTGRTHQIRVHLNAYGLPIVGDLTYCPTKLREKNRLPTKRIFLQAVRLGFRDLDGTPREYAEPLDTALRETLEHLRRR